jgi:hypothetical protein
MQRQRFLFAALGLLTLWRWALLPTLELAPDEGAGGFSRENTGTGADFPKWGPLVPLFVRLGMLIGGDGEFGVRFFAPLLALAASLAVWRLMRSLFDAQIAGWAVVIVNVLPAFNLARRHADSGHGGVCARAGGGAVFACRLAACASAPLGLVGRGGVCFGHGVGHNRLHWGVMLAVTMVFAFAGAAAASSACVGITCDRRSLGAGGPLLG